MNGNLQTPLGQLKILDIFFSYDGPRIFTCSNNSTKYLAFLVNELDETDHWLFAPVTNMRIREIKGGFLSIREALVNAEDKIVFQVHLPVVEGVKATLESITCDEIPEEFLPQINSHILVPDAAKIEHYSELPEKQSVTVEEAFESARDVFDLAIELTEESYEMECGVFGDALTSLQYTVYALDGRWLSNQRKPPNYVVEDNTINVTTLYQSSFGIRIKSKQSADVFRITPATKAIKGLSELILESRDRQTLQEKLKSISPRAVMWYQRFLGIFQGKEVSLQIDWAAPNQETISVKLTKKQLVSAYELTKETTETVLTFKVKGVLIAVNLKRNTFYIESEDGNDYSGSLSEEIQQFVSKGYTFGIPMKVEVLIEVKTILNVSTNTEIENYKLLEVYTNDENETSENGESN